MQLAPTEKKMWEKSQSKKHISEVTDEQINAKYESGEQRILTEMNREKLPNTSRLSLKQSWEWQM